MVSCAPGDFYSAELTRDIEVMPWRVRTCNCCAAEPRRMCCTSRRTLDFLASANIVVLHILLCPDDFQHGFGAWCILELFTLMAFNRFVLLFPDDFQAWLVSNHIKFTHRSDMEPVSLRPGAERISGVSGSSSQCWPLVSSAGTCVWELWSNILVATPIHYLGLL